MIRFRLASVSVRWTRTKRLDRMWTLHAGFENLSILLKVRKWFFFWRGKGDNRRGKISTYVQFKWKLTWSKRSSGNKNNHRSQPLANIVTQFLNWIKCNSFCNTPFIQRYYTRAWTFSIYNYLVTFRIDFNTSMDIR